MDSRTEKAVIRVAGGRGFKVAGKFRSLVITAAHCLPHFPPCHAANSVAELTYPHLLGPLDAADPTVWAECLFADPVADIAVLGSPDDHVLSDEAEAYEALLEDRPALSITDTPEEASGWLLSLDGRWFRCSVGHLEFGPLWIKNPTESISFGMSGSPIVDDNGAAIGAVSVGEFLSPRLAVNLPVWVLRESAAELG